MIFLVYEARSGSTLLASLLNSIDTLGVTIEDSIPWGLGLIDTNYRKKEKIYNVIKNDKKFKEWNIDNSSIKEIINNNGDILENILEFYFSNRDKKIKHYVYKCPIYIQQPHKILKKYPESKIIHIYRDPRAVYSSQKKNKISSKNKFFSTNPYSFSKIWKKSINEALRFNIDSRFYNLCYESLVNDTENTLKGVCNFIGVQYKVTNKSDYYSHIPEDQKYLHKNVNDKPLKKRINAWKKVLSNEEIKIIESCLSQEIKKLKYQSISKKVNFKYFFTYLKFFLIHYYDFIVNLVKLFFHPQRIFLKLRNR